MDNVSVIARLLTEYTLKKFETEYLRITTVC